MLCGGCCKKTEQEKLVVPAPELAAAHGASPEITEFNDPFLPKSDLAQKVRPLEEKEDKAATTDKATKPGQSYKDGHAFTITIRRPNPGQSLGVTFDACMPLHIYVSKVGEPGTLSPELQNIRQGDFIIAVNGAQNAAMSQELKEAKPGAELVLDVRRPIEYDVFISKGASLGCGIIYDAQIGNTLSISNVQDGPVQSWNERMRQEGRLPEVVREGDRILSVNGQVSTASDLLTAIREARDLRLRMSRPCFDD
uniref:PDZ domain-containing protein n=1 Tax=Alexandrium andersonii TaxID=327968 RepID=A0A7S2AIT0_9DINO|mmetsp:Transcript_13181/g.29920  ORF Transcript_13181/g.29920 Transcript_13181/m.29920 type:complete len:253 (+) Transcript_13181:83-841(+)